MPSILQSQTNFLIIFVSIFYNPLFHFTLLFLQSTGQNPERPPCNIFATPEIRRFYQSSIIASASNLPVRFLRRTRWRRRTWVKNNKEYKAIAGLIWTPSLISSTWKFCFHLIQVNAMCNITDWKTILQWVYRWTRSPYSIVGKNVLFLLID